MAQWIFGSIFRMQGVVASERQGCIYDDHCREAVIEATDGRLELS